MKKIHDFASKCRTSDCIFQFPSIFFFKNVHRLGWCIMKLNYASCDIWTGNWWVSAESRCRSLKGIKLCSFWGWMKTCKYSRLQTARVMIYSYSIAVDVPGNVLSLHMCVCNISKKEDIDFIYPSNTHPYLKSINFLQQLFIKLLVVDS